MGGGVQPRLIAHRAFAGAHPENTVEAVRAAVDEGADAIEIDVRPSADDGIVVFHDEALDDTGDSRGITDGEGRVADLTREELTDAEVLGSGATVPMLGEVLEAVPADFDVHIELKGTGEADVPAPETGALDEADVPGRRAAWHPFVRDAFAVTNEFDGDLLFTSFHEGALAAVSDIAPDANVAPLTLDAEEGLTIARRYDAAAINPPLALVADTPYADHDRDEGVDLVAAAHEEGYDVNVWTIRTWHEAAVAADAGVDGLIADYPCIRDPIPDGSA